MIDVCTQESLQFKIVPTGHLYDSGMTHFFLNDSVHPLIRWKRQVTLIPIFLLVCLSRGATYAWCLLHSGFRISTHAPHTRRDAASPARSDKTNAFLHTRLLRGATSNPIIKEYTFETFLLTRLLRGATRRPEHLPTMWLISTHAPLARRDRYN